MRQITDQDKRERYDQLIALAERLEEQDGVIHFYEIGEGTCNLLEDWGFWEEVE